MAAYEVSEMFSRVPVIVILGATGSGKSKLAIEIATQYGGEILSADSMQVYKGLDVITNKVTAEERAQAPHHMLDLVSPLQRFSVVDFRNQSVRIIDDLLKRDKLPVVVGGTNYYIESLLWKVLVQQEEGAEDADGELTLEREGDDASTKPERQVTESCASETSPVTSIGAGKTGDGIGRRTTPDDECAPCATSETRIVTPSGEKRTSDEVAHDDDDVDTPWKRLRLEDLDAVPSPELHRRLQQVDPESAARLHPNNRRRITRALQVLQQHGRTLSAILREQRAAAGGSDLGGPLRYPHSAILWLQCDQTVLDTRLDARVEDMLKRGLVQELLDFHRAYNQQRLISDKEADYTKGIFQSIGFKEFHSYLVLTDEERASARGQELLALGVAALKLVTRRYARRQLRWVTNRFLRRPDRQVPPVYGLDVTDPSRWEELVHQPAAHIISCLLQGTTPTSPCPLPVVAALINAPTSHHCDICDRLFIGTMQWEAHQKSRKHQKVLLRKKRENEAANVLGNMKTTTKDTHTSSE